MVNKKLGVKRECPNCSAKFYDLNKAPAVCPKCEHSFEPVKAPKPKKERVEPPKETQKAPVTASPKEEAQPEGEVTFEEADAELTTVASARIAGLDEEDESEEDDAFIAANGGDENDALLAADDEDDDDVSAMIDADITVDD